MEKAAEMFIPEFELWKDPLKRLNWFSFLVLQMKLLILAGYSSSRQILCTIVRRVSLKSAKAVHGQCPVLTAIRFLRLDLDSFVTWFIHFLSILGQILMAPRQFVCNQLFTFHIGYANVSAKLARLLPSMSPCPGTHTRVIGHPRASLTLVFEVWRELLFLVLEDIFGVECCSTKEILIPLEFDMFDV
ncbi:hypothetical protein FF38_13696 [Lucilia cuprina]|uniref:Uncharacterized protein n=1 Tax=Lucilia cuprina TaxID=7375 RepID=A0A0L0BW35_LUCCU|nr:hypothetical protein FF38_13696 [Lucilia cuprina]